MRIVGRGNRTASLRLIVIFLRSHADMTQAEFGKAAGIQQGDISRYESGQKVPSEEILRRMAGATDLPWSIVAHLRRFFSKMLTGAEMRRAAEAGNAPLDRAVLESSLLALTSHLIEDDIAAAEIQTPEEARQAAANLWKGLLRLAVRHRRRLVDLSMRSSRNWALMVLVCDTSLKAGNPEDAMEMAKLGLLIAERVPGEEGWRSRVKGYAHAHMANAYRMAGDFARASETFALARDFWQAGIDPEDLIPEEPWREIEAALR
ncbi:MAG TPA: helix-turn-helix transcriptional regulator [Thermoanaerobaculia bacterium]|nr:helix-turn-helix transcriptional regulator [Thermoanaerobaculia bacterium]